MLYVFHGEDGKRARDKWHAVIKAFETRQSTGLVFRFTSDDFDAAAFVELISSSDLFGGKRLVAGDHLSENETAPDLIENNLADLVGSPNTFVLLEGAISADLIKSLKTSGAKLEEHPLALRSAAPPFNIFAVNDAFIARDRRRLWLVYQQALMAGLAEEEIFWKLVWQVKAMLIAGQQTGEIKTLKSFALGKAKRGLTKFKLEELKKISGRLVALWHESHRGAADFGVGLEKLLLSV